MKIKNIIVFILVAFLTVGSTLNTHSVSINLIFGELSIPLILLIFICFFTGFVSGYIILKIIAYRRNHEKSDKPIKEKKVKMKDKKKKNGQDKSSEDNAVMVEMEKDKS